MEIRNLVTFLRIAELQNFSKAAEQLGYSQSAVTMQIKQLEAELGAQLFERIGKQVKLTQAGERLRPHALDIVTSVQKAVRTVREPERISGRLRIGTCESYVISRLPPVILEMSRRCQMCIRDSIFNSMTAVPVAEAQQIVAKSNVHDIVLAQGA